MKIKNFTIIYSIFIILVITAGIIFFNRDAHVNLDITSFHKQSFDIKTEYLAGADIPSLESKYNCTVTLIDSSNYKEIFWQAVSHSDVILDLTDDEDNIIGKIIYSTQKDAYEKDRRLLEITLFVILGVVFAFGYIILLFIWTKVIRPFQRMQFFANEVARGNLDFKLPMIKDNYFGAFTESFDLLREELKIAREQEYLANQSKKELVAELSHDIKTPLSTIKANCELIEVTSKDESVLNRINVINGKTETIEQLVDNLFHATLEELQVLKVEPTEESTENILYMIDNMTSYGDVIMENELPGCLVWMDKLRFGQVIDNIFFNSYKYAGTAIHVSFENKDDGIVIKIADEGPGVPEEELPLVAEKFYRGKNSTGKQGSGLGLFLAKNFMQEMKGDLNYYNRNGFVVELFLMRV